MKNSKRTIILVSAIGVIALATYAYSQYGFSLSKFFAAEPSVTGSSLCKPVQQTVVSGQPATVSLVVPSPTLSVSKDTARKPVQATVKPVSTGKAPIYVAKWTAEGGNPKEGIGNSFTTIFTNATYSTAVREIVVNYNGQKSVCRVTVLVLPSPTPPMPTVSVTTPNGGELWVGGTVQAINWSATNVNSNNLFGVRLLKNGQIYEGTYIYPSTTRSVPFTIAHGTSGNDFKVEVVLYSDSHMTVQLTADQSDKNLTIIPSPPSSTPTPTSTSTPTPTN